MKSNFCEKSKRLFPKSTIAKSDIFRWALPELQPPRLRPKGSLQAHRGLAMLLLSLPTKQCRKIQSLLIIDAAVLLHFQSPSVSSPPLSLTTGTVRSVGQRYCMKAVSWLVGNSDTHAARCSLLGAVLAMALRRCPMPLSAWKRCCLPEETPRVRYDKLAHRLSRLDERHGVV